MADVMLSIRPKWCELIANGEKTVEVRKTRPRQETPFRCFIYCTRPRFEHEDFICLETDKGVRGFHGGGAVIGEFVCDKIYRIEAIAPLPWGGSKGSWAPFNPNDACLTVNEIEDYIDGKDGFGWHISNLVIYDNPVPLAEFGEFGMKRPPQSWCYVKDVG